MSYRNVCEVIVPNDLCIGCGLCIGVCPPNVLKMEFNQYGEYIPLEFRNGCLPKCDLCLQTCPFWDQGDNEDTLGAQLFGKSPKIGHRIETGYYQDTYAGFSKVGTQRADGASGGLATWFLQRLLEEQIVDKVACVIGTSDPEKLYQFEIIDKVEDVGKASKSCYYPVEVGTVIRQIMETDGRYAITGLPCFLKGIRLAMRKNRRLRKRIVVLVGIVCGQTKSKSFVEYLSALRGADPNAAVDVKFRVKDPQRPATDYGHQFSWQEAGEHKSEIIFWSEGIEQAWTHGYFKPNACNYCDDVFAEMADVSFMDAWLPQYSSDYRGHTLVINRNRQLKPIWEQALSSTQVSLERIDIDSVIRSQRGVLEEKRNAMQFRLAVAKQAGQRTPHKRFAPTFAGAWLDKRLWMLKLQASRRSRQLWQSKKNVGDLHRSLRWISIQIHIIRFLKRIKRMIEDGRAVSALQKRISHCVKRGAK